MPKAREIGRRSSLEILETGAKELGLPPGTSGTHKRALRSRGLFSRHSRKMHREESKLEEEQEDQAEADASPRSLDGCSGDGEEKNRGIFRSLEPTGLVNNTSGRIEREKVMIQSRILKKTLQGLADHVKKNEKV